MEDEISGAPTSPPLAKGKEERAMTPMTEEAAVVSHEQMESLGIEGEHLRAMAEEISESFIEEDLHQSTTSQQSPSPAPEPRLVCRFIGTKLGCPRGSCCPFFHPKT